MIDLINHLGGRTNTVLFLLMILSFFILSSFIKNKSLKVIWSITSSSILTLQFFSLYATQRFIGYQFYLHCEIKGLIGVGGLFWKQIILGVTFFLINTVVLYLSDRIFNNHRITKLLLLFISLGILIGQGKLIEDIRTLSQIVFLYDDTNFEEVLNKYNFSDYTTPKKIKATAGKNVIIISIESMERGIFSNKFDSIAKNLHQLKKDWNYIDIQQNTGSSWTSGSLYTFMTGFPAFFGMEKNEVFKNAYHSNISSLGSVFSTCNYNTTTVIGSGDFSGTSEMLNCFHINKIIDYSNTSDKGTRSVFGLKDKDVFDEAKVEVDRLSKLKEPYSLIISTTDTHFPGGIYDNRMEGYVPKGLFKMEYSMASLDYLLNDFLMHLKNNGVLENTSIFIFPDHLKMGDPGIFEKTGERGLYLISNEDLSQFEDQNLYQIDLPKIILASAHIKHNLLFLTDFIEGDKEEYIRNHIYELTEINTKGILNPRVKKFDPQAISKDYEKYKIDRSKFIAQAGGVIDKENYTNSLEALNNSYKKGFRFFELDFSQTKDKHIVAAHSWKAFHYFLGDNKADAFNYKDFISSKIYGKYSPLDMNLINQWFAKHTDAVLMTDNPISPKKLINLFVDNQRLMLKVFNMNDLDEALKLNFRTVIPHFDLINEMNEKQIKEYVDKGVQYYTMEYYNSVDQNEQINYYSSLGLQPICYGLDLSSYNVDFYVKYHMDNIKAFLIDDYNFEKK
ncbi:sulfatase-like hydrolase/transferase [Flammeovirga sp. MY04]|uniref:sulfatase-like hydrolase/transferase n=1 Tax=Flammeovirga sp. MY04 TaxID=1191459 RepID=UPI000806100F|nr:sulfatase-like hydrolase/transferase [Flammeovirga sp. MY04]ANQ52180.1 sulfatase-like hydrolase/transferase [Flammeovirga sp. MY04]